MLEALVILMTLSLFGLWWSKQKDFNNYLEGQTEMTGQGFCMYGILTFVVIGFILLVFASLLPEFLPKHIRHIMENHFEYSFFTVCVIVGLYIWLQYRRYINRKNRER